MIKTFVEVPSFTKEWKDLNLDDNDLRNLQLLIIYRRLPTVFIEGTGGIKKIRFPLLNRSKSRSIRVCFIDFQDLGVIYLLTTYAKKKKENLSDAEKNELKKLVKILKDEAAKKESDYHERTIRYFKTWLN